MAWLVHVTVFSNKFVLPKTLISKAKLGYKPESPNSVLHWSWLLLRDAYRLVLKCPRYRGCWEPPRRFLQGIFPYAYPPHCFFLYPWQCCSSRHIDLNNPSQQPPVALNMYFILCAIFHSARGARSQARRAKALLAYRKPHLHLLLEMLVSVLGNLSRGGLHAFVCNVRLCSYLVLLNPTLIDIELTDLFKTW